MSDDNAILELRGLSKKITLHILDSAEIEPFRDVSFRVDAGEFVAVIGPSGSGKSSIVKAVHRTYVPTEGQAWYRTADGVEVDLAAAPDREVIRLRRREIGFVSQFLRVEPRVPCIDVVAAPLLRLGRPADEARRLAAGLLERLDVPQRLWSSYPSLFSGGEQQRVNIARAIIARPRLLLADEPTSALDTANTARVTELLGDAQREGMTILGVFHDLQLIRRLADRVLVMERGALVNQGRVEDIELLHYEQKQEFAPRV
jgi:alpha-D-ribose 1-methylphosphonate 5-triphosphate synthase subunit PhnL